MAHQPRPFIGVNADYVPATKVHGSYVPPQRGYLDTVLMAGGLPMIVPPLGKEIDSDAWLDRLDGFVLTGGLDWIPRRCGLPTHSSMQSSAGTPRRQRPLLGARVCWSAVCRC